MYPSAQMMSAGRKLPGSNFTNVKTVEVVRSRNGYGFTIAGQHPCVLSCIMPNTPAEMAMLKPGDCVIAINGENVTKLDHEQFIKRIGETTGVLRLTVADMVPASGGINDNENFYDGGYQVDIPQHTARTSTPGIQRSQMVLDELNSGALFHAFPARNARPSQQMYYGEVAGLYNRQTDMPAKFAPGHLSPLNRASQQVAVRNGPQVTCLWNGQHRVHEDHVTRYKNRQQRAQRSYYVQEDPYADGEDGHDDETRALMPYELNNITYPSMVMEQPKTDHIEEGDFPLVKVVIGYLGSVDIPAAANLPTASLQAIRGCVRRLRVEQRVHSLMIMNIALTGITLISANSQVSVIYPADKIVFSGICPDDKRCFGVVTVQNPSPRPEEDDEEQIGSACHVFIVDPELCSHDMHEEISLRFGLNCMPNPENHTCVEYPASSRVVLHHVSQYYQDKQDNSHFGDFYGQSPYIGINRRSNSASSNSDSGIGNGGREVMQNNDSDQIVDVASHIRNKRANRTLSLQKQGLSSSLANQKPTIGDGSASHNSQTNVDYDLSGSSSPGSNEMSNPLLKVDLEQRLRPRARPTSMISPPRPSADSPVRSASVSVFEVPSVPSEKDIRRQPLRPLSLEPGWENSADLPSGTESMMQEVFRSRPAPIWNQYLQASRNQQSMASLRRGSDCSDYSTAHQNARWIALQRAQQRLNAYQNHPLNRNSLTASDSELNTIDEPPLRQDENTSSQADLAEENPPEVGRVSGWAVSFERLLKDELGLAYFTDFLKQEFSEENILFWISCEQLSKIKCETELKDKAETIYRRFLSSYATMPVNLEGNYRQMVESAIKNPTPEMYKDQQLQIFKLMKLDSYSRFLKSKLYQDCVLSEMGNLPMPTIEGQSITELGSGSDKGSVQTPTPPPTPDSNSLEKKPKKKVEKGAKNKVQEKEAPTPESPSRQISEEKRQRSLLPWFKGFTNKRTSARSDIERETHFYVTSPEPHLPTSQSETQLSRTAYYNSLPRGPRSMSQFSATFPNNVLLTIKVVPDKTIGEVLLPLCEEQGLTQQTAEIFLKTTKGGLVVKEKLIDLTQDVSALAGRDIIVERRVVFKIELPCKRLIGVKSKPTKKLIEVLRPVTYKYDLQLDKLVVHLNNSPIPLDLEITVAALDNQRIMVETFEQYSANSDSLVKTGDIRSKGNVQSQQHPKLRPTLSSPSQKRSSQSTNEKVVVEKQPAPRVSGGDLKSTTVQQNNNNHRGGLRVTDTDDASDLYRLVAKANRRRMDDQRGLTLRNLEVPDFLLPKDPPERPQTSLGFTEAEQNRRNQEANTRLTQDGKRPTSTPPKGAGARTGSLPAGTGFASGTLPTHEEAAALFGALNGLENISFGEYTSDYPESMANTSRSHGDGMSPEPYSIPEEPTPDRVHREGQARSDRQPKLSGVSITSETDLPSAYGASGVFQCQNGSGQLPGYDRNSTLKAEDQDHSNLVAAASIPDVTLEVDVSEVPRPSEVGQQNGSSATLPRRSSRNNNYLKTLYEESSSQDIAPAAGPRVTRKPVVPPKPPAKRTMSLPAEKKIITVIGADGTKHRATFV